MEIPLYLKIHVFYTSTIDKWQLDVKDFRLNSWISGLIRKNNKEGKNIFDLRENQSPQHACCRAGNSVNSPK